MNSTIQERLAKWNAFVEGQSGAFMFHVNFPLPEEEAKLPPAVLPWPNLATQRIERAWAQYEIMCRKAERAGDDRVPFLSNITGTEIFAEAFGCTVHRPDDANPFALPFIHTAAEADRIKPPELSGSTLAYLFDIADELHRRDPDAVMKPVDIQSPMDIVALIWEKKDLFCAMIESPEAVKALAEKVRAVLIAFFDEWFGRYGTTFVAHYPDYVMHGGITVSVDEIGAVDAALFREFFREELIALSDHFGGLGIHCCADARHQWENLCALPRLKVINHNVPPTRDAREYLPDALRFYGKEVAQMPVGWAPDPAPDTWPAQFPEGARVIFEVQTDSAVKVAALADQLQERREAGRAAAAC